MQAWFLPAQMQWTSLPMQKARFFNPPNLLICQIFKKRIMAD